MVQVLAPLLKDGYKVGHPFQYPTNTVKIYSNFTPRKSRVKGIDSIILFGLIYFIKDVLIDEFTKNFWDLDEDEAVAKYERRMRTYLPGNNLTYDHIRALHRLGYMPVLIKSLPEGSLVKTGVPVMTITNTLPEFYWVPNFLETVLSCELWPMCTSATTAFNYRLIFDQFAMDTVGNTDFSSTFQIHDFAMRGQMGRFAAMMNGAAHLTASKGTDTIPAIDFLEEYYNCNSDEELIGASIPATEHSVMCMGKKESELETFKRLITEVYASGFVAIVADTWDFWGVVRPKTGIAAQLHDIIMGRDGRVVFRPDSGDPILIITGYTADEVRVIDGQTYRLEDTEEFAHSAFRPIAGRKPLLEEEVKGAIQCLYEEFGGTISEKGYKVLDTHVGLIYGDSITLDRARTICQRLMDKGFASTNWVAGVGSYTYQYVTRDTYGWAMKATYGEVGHNITDLQIVDGRTLGLLPGDTELTDLGSAEEWGGEVTDAYVVEPREIFKDPITDRDPITGVSIKKSAKGYLRVDQDANGDYSLTDQVTEEEEEKGALRCIFEDGIIYNDAKLSDIRDLVNKNVLRLLNK